MGFPRMLSTSVPIGRPQNCNDHSFRFFLPDYFSTVPPSHACMFSNSEPWNDVSGCIYPFVNKIELSWGICKAGVHLLTALPVDQLTASKYSKKTSSKWCVLISQESGSVFFLQSMWQHEAVLFKSYCPNTQTDTHNGPIARPGPLKWSVTVVSNSDQ